MNVELIKCAARDTQRTINLPGDHKAADNPTLRRGDWVTLRHG